jgi:hypothetical protein
MPAWWFGHPGLRLTDPMPITGSTRLAYFHIGQATCRAEAFEF